MAFSSQTVTIPYVAGINESNGDVNVNAWFAPYAQNIHTTYGVMESARGYREFIPTPIPGVPTRIYLFTDLDTATGVRKRHIVVTTQDKVLVWDESLVQWRALMEGAQSGEWGFVTYQTADDVIMILGNAVDNVKYWDGKSDALKDLAGVPCKGRFFTVHYERIWMGGDPALPNSVFYSRQFDPNNWTGDVENPAAGGGQVDFPSFETGGFITGITTANNEVVIMKESTAIRIYGTSPSSYTAYELAGGIGTRAERAIVGYGGVKYFLTRHGLGAQSGSAVSMLGDRAMPRLFDGMYYEGSSERLNIAYQNTACGTRYDEKLWFAVPLGDSTENNALIEYDPNRETLMLHRGLSVTDFALCNQEDNYVVFVGRNRAGEYKIYAYGDALGYDGVAQDSHWSSPWQDFGDKGRRKIVRQMRAYGVLETVDKRGAQPSVVFELETDRGRFERVMTAADGVPQRFRFGTRLSGERFKITIRSGENTRFRFTGGVEMEVEAE